MVPQNTSLGVESHVTGVALTAWFFLALELKIIHLTKILLKLLHIWSYKSFHSI